MITDVNLQVSTAQAVTATAVSTNSIDLGTARDMGMGEDLYFAISVIVAALAAGLATVEFEVITADDAALTTNVTSIGSTGPIPKAKLVAGATLFVEPRSQIGSLGRRYLGVRYKVATGPLTAGAFTADMVLNVSDSGKHYASGFTVN